MKNKIFIILMVISANLFSLKNWQIHTNSTHIYEIEQVGDKIYIASWGGLEVYDLNTSTFEKKYTTIDGLSKNDIRALDYYAEREEFLFGTYGGGVNCMSNNEFQMPINEIIGLASDYVNKIVHQDSLIFIATKEGLSLFVNNPDFPFPFLVDNYNVENGLSANNITSLQIADNRYLYCGSQFGLDYVHIDSIGFINSWHHFNTDNSILPSNNISSISIKKSKIAIATDNGVLTSSDLNDPEQSQLYCEGLAVFPVFWDSQDNLWLSYGVWNSDLLVIQDTMDIAVTRISENGDIDDWLQNETGLTTNIMDFEEINNQICAITWGEGLFVFNSDNWETQIKPDCIIANVVTDMKIDDNHKLWISNGHIGGGMISKGTRGVSGFDGENWSNYSAKQSPLRSDNILTISVDSMNRKWFGSWDTDYQVTGWRDGISIYNENNNTWSSLTTNNGLLTNTISYIKKDNQNRMWVTSYDGGMNILNSEEELIHQFQIPFIENQKILMPFFAKDKIYFGSYYNGISIWDDNSLSSGIFPTSSGSYWMQPPFTELLVAEIYSITDKYNSETEEIWVASSNGLFMYDNEHWFQYGTNIKKKVWLDNEWFWNENVPDPEYWYYEGQERLYGSVPTYPTALFVDPFGLIWIGTRDAGITVFNKERDIFTNLTTENTPLISNNITTFAYEPLTGTLYIGTSDGLNSVEIGISAESNTETKLYDTIAYPNPFYPDNGEILRIENESSITMPKGETICKIYDLSGELILKLEKDIYEQFSWDGTNKAGKKCSSGIYFYIVSASGGQVSKGKIVLVR